MEERGLFQRAGRNALRNKVRRDNRDAALCRALALPGLGPVGRPAHQVRDLWAELEGDAAAVEGAHGPHSLAIVGVHAGQRQHALGKDLAQGGRVALGGKELLLRHAVRHVLLPDHHRLVYLAGLLHLPAEVGLVAHHHMGAGRPEVGPPGGSVGQQGGRHLLGDLPREVYPPVLEERLCCAGLHCLIRLHGGNLWLLLRFGGLLGRDGGGWRVSCGGGVLVALRNLHLLLSGRIRLHLLRRRRFLNLFLDLGLLLLVLFFCSSLGGLLLLLLLRLPGPFRGCGAPCLLGRHGCCVPLEVHQLKRHHEKVTKMQIFEV